MSPGVGWALAIALVALAWHAYGWQGAVFGVTAVVFWLLLQFSRALRAVRRAADAPVGEIASAVMLNAKLQPGMRMMTVLGLTRSLGRRVGHAPESWAWRDAGGAEVTVELRGGKVSRWTLTRPGGEPPAA